MIKADPPILKQKIFLPAVHEHEMTRHTPETSRGWNCNGNYFPGATGCESGLRGFHQSEHIQGYFCRSCDFDVCLKCMIKKAKLA